MTIESAVLAKTVIIGFSMPEGIISLDAPVTINDSLILNCLNNSQNATKLMGSLGFPANRLHSSVLLEFRRLSVPVQFHQHKRQLHHDPPICYDGPAGRTVTPPFNRDRLT